jgi:hypothetical protein
VQIDSHAWRSAGTRATRFDVTGLHLELAPCLETGVKKLVAMLLSTLHGDRGWVGVCEKKYLGRHLQNVDVVLAIRSEGSSEQVAVEISFMSSPKKIARANYHHAARRTRDHPYLTRQLSNGEIWTAHGVLIPMV